MKAFTVVALLAAVASSGVWAGSIDGKNARAPWYNCLGKPEGDYVNPRSCHSYISCTRASIAYEMDCPKCDSSAMPASCPDGVLVFDAVSKRCEWADQATCGADVTSEPPEVTPTEGPTEEPTTAEPVTRPPPPSNTTRPNPGDPCDPLDCKNGGECKDFWVCDKNSSTIVYGNCGRGMFWNPLSSGGIHGGNCDLWENLTDDQKEELWKDPKCLECKWLALGECSQTYKYLERNSKTLKFDTIDCGTNIVFDAKWNTCLHCSNVTDTTTGSPCCAILPTAEV